MHIYIYGKPRDGKACYTMPCYHDGKSFVPSLARADEEAGPSLAALQ